MWQKIEEGKKWIILAALALMAILIFLKTIDSYLDKDGLYLFDQSINNIAISLRSPLLDPVMILITNIGDWQIVIWGLILGVILLGVANKWRNAWALIISVVTGYLFTELSKQFFARPRPPIESAMILEKSLSFPSGHSYFAIVFYGLITYFWVKYFQNQKNKIIIGLLGMSLILLIGLSRIYLGVHWFTDIVAGFSSSLAWLLLTISYLEYKSEKLAPEMNKYSSKTIWRWFWLFTLLWLSGLGWLLWVKR